jgi:hypothetical protein
VSKTPPLPDIADLQRIALKIFLSKKSVLRPAEIIPVFHRWIQTKAVAGLLIDVADYSHLPTGPSVLLVAHEGHYVLDQTEGRLGLQYTRTQPLKASLPDRLLTIGRALIQAGRLLEQDKSLSGPIEFLGNEFQCLANDRLRAPNRVETLTTFKPALDTLLAKIAADVSWTLTREPDPGARFGVHVKSQNEITLENLATSLEKTT